MKHIILTADQARAVREAGEAVEVRDEQGRLLAHLNPLPPADIEAIERSRLARARGDQRIPSDQVQTHLRRLEEIRRSEGMDEAKMLDLLHRMRAGEQV
jgi:hypothetical protein